MKKRLIVLIVVGIIFLLGLGWYFVNKTVPINILISGGPGGCMGPDCEEFCQQKPQECQKWCMENPKICRYFMGWETTTKIVDPPDTVITYAKSLNIFGGKESDVAITKAKELGANMITIWPPRMVKNEEFNFFPEMVSNTINIAHKNGLQVELRSSFSSPEEVEDYEKFRVNSLKHVAEYAKFAERYKVYRIVPFGEVDNHLIKYCDKVTEFSQEMLQEIKKHYSGKIGIGVVGFWRDCGYTFKGYDYLTVSAYPHNDVATTIGWARQVANRSDILTLHLGETGVMNPEETDPIAQFQTLVLSKQEEAEFYNEFFENYFMRVDGISIFADPHMAFLGIYGDPAEEVIKDWYTNKLPD